MASDRKKPRVALWATVVVAVLVLYVASEGPATWLNWWLYWNVPPSRPWDRALEAALEAVYAPADWGFSLAPENVREIRSAYLTWGTSPPGFGP